VPTNPNLPQKRFESNLREASVQKLDKFALGGKWNEAALIPQDERRSRR
jgi:hypothetical protein